MRTTILGLTAVHLFGSLLLTAAKAQTPDTSSVATPSNAASADEATSEPQLELATFGSGCFWCTEAVFQRLNGVESAVSGYSGGRVDHPTYQQVLTGLTGHAEVVQISFDPSVISYAELLEVFWRTHDPTTLNRQGPDVGTQYRSVIFFHSPDQQQTAEEYRQQLNASGDFRRPIVTEIAPYNAFYPAEKYHQDFFELNPRQGYCRLVIAPKIRKFSRQFKKKLKPVNK